MVFWTTTGFRGVKKVAHPPRDTDEDVEPAGVEAVAPEVDLDVARDALVDDGVPSCRLLSGDGLAGVAGDTSELDMLEGVEDAIELEALVGLGRMRCGGGLRKSGINVAMVVGVVVVVVAAAVSDVPFTLPGVKCSGTFSPTFDEIPGPVAAIPTFSFTFDMEASSSSLLRLSSCCCSPCFAENEPVDPTSCELALPNLFDSRSRLPAVAVVVFDALVPAFMPCMTGRAEEAAACAELAAIASGCSSSA